MGFFTDFASGVIEGLTANQSQGKERGRIDRLCRELGWEIDERGTDQVVLHFKDPAVGIRKVFIVNGDDALITFVVYSYTILPSNRCPPEVCSHLLIRNNEVGVGAWRATIDRDSDVLFSMAYAAEGRGFSAAMLKFTCDVLVREAIGFDEKMAKAGLLRR